MKPLRTHLADYLNLRRSIGFKMTEAKWRLQRFVSFMEQQKATIITRRLALVWAQQGIGAVPSDRLEVIRGFAKYVSAFEPRTEIPPTDMLPSSRARRRPHVYSEEEIRQLLEAAWTAVEDRPAGTYYCLFGLLVTTGMRIGEALRLEFKDIDFETGLLTVRKSKFGKSRLVPLHCTTVHELMEYKKRRDEVPAAQLSPYLFVTHKGTSLNHSNVDKLFKQISVLIGLRKMAYGRSGPRIHDMRHTFAVRTLVDWYRSAQRIEAHIPTLSTYLGHARVADTYWYLTEHPELMQQAAQRLEKRWKRTNAK